MDERNIRNDYIFFLNYSDELPEFFYYFSERFSNYNIKLIPINIDDIFKIEKNKVSFVLSVVTNLDAAVKYKLLQKRIVEFSLLNKRLFLFDVNSFGRISYYKKLIRMRNYVFYQLPASFIDITNDIFQIYDKISLKGSQWPGGSRARLPEMPPSQ